MKFLSIASVFAVFLVGLFSYEDTLLTIALRSLVVFLVLFIPGYVFLSLFVASLNADAKMASSFAISIVFLSILTLVMIELRFEILITIIVILAFVLLPTVYFFKRKLYLELLQSDKFGFLAVILLYVLLTAFQSLLVFGYATPSYRFPIFEGDYLTSYGIAKILLHRLDPRVAYQQPLLWGLGVNYRTPLLAIVYAFFLILFGNEELIVTPPDVSPAGIVLSGTYYTYQLVQCALDSLFLLPLFLLIQKLFTRKVAILTSLFLLMNPLFVWSPAWSGYRNFTLYFLFLFYYFLVSQRFRKNYLFAGLYAGLAYLAGTFSAVYVAGGFIYLLLGNHFKPFIKKSLYILSTLTVAVAPWLIWTRVIFGDIERSDLLWPFIVSEGQFEALGTLKSYMVLQTFFDTLSSNPLSIVENRLENLFRILFAVRMLDIGIIGLGVKALYMLYMYTLPGLLLLSVSPFSYYEHIKCLLTRTFRKETISFILWPFLFYILVYFGWVRWDIPYLVLFPIVPLMLALAAGYLSKRKILPLVIYTICLLENVFVLWSGVLYVSSAKLISFEAFPIILVIFAWYFLNMNLTHRHLRRV